MPIHVTIAATDPYLSLFEPLESRSQSHPIFSTKQVYRSKKRALDLEDGSPPRKGACFVRPSDRYSGWVAKNHTGRARPSKDGIHTFVNTPLVRGPNQGLPKVTLDVDISETLIFRNSPAGGGVPFSSSSSFAESSSPGTSFIMLSRRGPDLATADNGVTLGEELRDHFGLPFHAPLYFGQRASGAIGSNVVVKKFFRGQLPGDPITRDYRGHIVPRPDKVDQVKRQQRAAGLVGNAFQPTLWSDTQNLYLEAPLAKADFFDVILHTHHRRPFRESVEPAERPYARILIGMRLVADLLPQYKKLHQGGVSHNNGKATNVLMDNKLHFHLNGWGQARNSQLPAIGGVWENKRFESVLGHNAHTPSDDLWALGKIFVQAVLGAKESPHINSDKVVRFNDPFRPEFVFPDKSHPSGFELMEELPLIEANRIEAQALQMLWGRLHKLYSEWNAQKYKRASVGQIYEVPFPAPLENLGGASEYHAERIDFVFRRIAALDIQGTALRLALVLFEQDITKVRSAASIHRTFLPTFNNIFLTDFDSNLVTEDELDLPRGRTSPAFDAATDKLALKDKRRLLKRIDNERLLRQTLGAVDGIGMLECARVSNVHVPSSNRSSSNATGASHSRL